MGYKEIPISELRSVISYDPASGTFTNLVRRSNNARAGGRAGFKMKIGYIGINYKRSTYYAHRIAWAFVNGGIPHDMMIDHINGNPEDNRIENLRLVTQAQNMANARGHRDNPLPKGVKAAPHCRFKPYRAAIFVKGKSHELGYFKTPEEASAAYRDASVRLRGSFGRTD